MSVFLVALQANTLLAEWSQGPINCKGFGLTTIDSIILSSLFASSLFLNVLILSTFKQHVVTKFRILGVRRFFVSVRGFFEVLWVFIDVKSQSNHEKMSQLLS